MGMPESYILTSEIISLFILISFFKRLDYSCLGIVWVEGSLEFHPYGV